MAVNGDLSFEEFLRMMLPVFTGRFDDEQLYYAFKKFDTDGSGYITVKELRQILAKIGQHYTEEQIAELVAIVDQNNDGRLNFQEFVKLMKLPASR